jgi:hypothetical protein
MGLPGLGFFLLGHFLLVRQDFDSATQAAVRGSLLLGIRAPGDAPTILFAHISQRIFLLAWLAGIAFSCLLASVRVKQPPARLSWP